MIKSISSKTRLPGFKSSFVTSWPGELRGVSKVALSHAGHESLEELTSLHLCFLIYKMEIIVLIFHELLGD